MKSAHIGPIALNAYLVAKFLRRLGHAADSFDCGGGQSIMWMPWWEEAEFDPTGFYGNHVDWLPLARQTGFQRPPWAKILGNDAAEPWYDTQEAFQADLARYLPGVDHGRAGETPEQEREAIRAALAESRLTTEEQAQC